MKLMTIFGTRPEIIRLSVIIKSLDRFCEQITVHTGQNYDHSLSDVFFSDLDLRGPDHHLGVRESTFGAQVAAILARVDELLERTRPDRVLLLGDTNSGLSAIVAARRGVPVYHLEAGNRCYDNRVPEEINRRLIDHASTVLMPYTHRSKENLLREGIERQRIFVVGNPIYEVIRDGEARIGASNVLSQLGLARGGYFLATMHRAENVDVPDRLARLAAGLQRVASAYGQPVIVSLHPHTADRLRRQGIDLAAGGVRLLSPLGLWDFLSLERQARCVLSDSGTVQEECAIFRVPSVTIRDVTERAETIEAGSAILSGDEPDDILKAVEIVLSTPRDWSPPAEYLEPRVSATVTKIVLGYSARAA